MIEEHAVVETTPWVEYFKAMYEKLVNDDVVTMIAVEAFKNMHPVEGSPDCPGEALGRVTEAHLNFRRDLFKGLMEFVDSRGLR